MARAGGKAIILTAAVVAIVAGACAVYWVRAGRTITDPPVETTTTGPVLFEDQTEKVKLRFVHDAGPLPKDGMYFLPQIMGSGAGVFFDGDGSLNVVLLTNGGPNSTSTNRLLRRAADGTFQDISAGSGVDFAGYNMGVAIADVNNDGLPDILITQLGGLKLLLNRGNGKFEDVTRAAGLESRLWGMSAAFLDYNRDGWLDLVVVNYLEYDPTAQRDPEGRTFDYTPPFLFNKQVVKLFRNLGRPEGGAPGSVLFKDVTLESGLGAIAGYGLGVVALDFTGDGWPDIFVANDASPNHLWVNQRDGKTFKEEAVLRGIAFDVQGQGRANMGIAFGDVDGDGLFDVFVSHEHNEWHTLYKQGPRGMFKDVSAGAGMLKLKWRGTGFGTVLADFDHDGHLDLALVNGGVQHHKPVKSKEIDPDTFWQPYQQKNQLWLNDGKGVFQDISLANPAFSGPRAVSRGLVWADFDGDGGIDLLVTTVAGPALYYRNVAQKKGRWLMVRATDPTAGDRDAIGAEIVVEAGKRKWLGWINPASSYLCSNDPRAHFGLGSIDKVDAIRVAWPDGSQETFAAEGLDRVVHLRKGKGSKSAPGGKQP